MANPLIQVENIVKKYDDRPTILNGVTFTIESGAFVTIYGKSGCGKTTLLNIIGGLDRPSTGEVTIDGIKLGEMSEDGLAKTRMSKIGFVFQDYNLLQDLTIRENISLPLLLSKKNDGKRVDGLMRKFDIHDIAGMTANKVSGGEAQRAAIARAMANDPKIILADEPTGNLDAENTQNVMDMFQLARSEFGTTIVLATHDEDLARHATRSIRLVDGKAEE